MCTGCCNLLFFGKCSFIYAPRSFLFWNFLFFNYIIRLLFLLFFYTSAHLLLMAQHTVSLFLNFSSACAHSSSLYLFCSRSRSPPWISQLQWISHAPPTRGKKSGAFPFRSVIKMQNNNFQSENISCVARLSHMLCAVELMIICCRSKNTWKKQEKREEKWKWSIHESERRK